MIDPVSLSKKPLACSVLVGRTLSASGSGSGHTSISELRYTVGLIQRSFQKVVWWPLWPPTSNPRFLSETVRLLVRHRLLYLGNCT